MNVFSIAIDHHDENDEDSDNLTYFVDFVATKELSGYEISCEIAHCVAEFVQAKGWTDDVTISK